MHAESMVARSDTHDEAASGSRPTILIVTAGMGGGHLGAASQLSARLTDAGYDAPLFDLLGGMRLGYGRFITAFYRAQLRCAPWSYQAVYELWRRRPERLGPANAINTAMASRALCAAIERHHPIAVLSTYNLATQVLGALIDRGSIDVPTYTFITDFGVHPYWLHEAMSGYAVVHPLTARGVGELTSAPVVVTGPFVAPGFAPDASRRRHTREALGVSDDAVVPLVVAGAWGVGDVEATTADLEAFTDAAPVVVCGQNDRLARRLRRVVRDPSHVFGFVDTMPALMDASDVLVENTGGLTAMEAFVSGLPVITYRPIPAHGVDNAHVMAAAGVTRLALSRAELIQAVGAVTAAGPTHDAVVDVGRAVVHGDALDRLLGLVDPAGRSNPAKSQAVADASRRCERVS